VSVVAGIDVGNATTEVVLAHVADDGTEVIGTGRAPTRRAKGAPESLDGAAALVGRLQRQHGVRVERAVAAPLRPVATAVAALPEERADTGRLWLATAGASTAGGRGVGVGRPVRFGAPTGGDHRWSSPCPAAPAIGGRRGTRRPRLPPAG
jgi:hypothetical protein